MKRVIFLFVGIIFAMNVSAQVMVLHLKDGNTHEYSVSLLDCIDFIAYYKSEGHTCMPAGETDEETGKPIYMFANAETGIFITYCDSCGVVQELSRNE